MRKFILIFAVSIVQLTYAQTLEEKGPIITPGVLKIETFYRDSVKLLNNMIYLKSLDLKIVDSLFIPCDNYSQFTKEIKSRGYYPQETYGIIYMDSYPIKNGYYKVYCNDNWYYVNNVEGFTLYMPWDDFIMHIVSVGSTAGNPLRKQPSVASQIMNYDYPNVRMVPKKVQGEWLYVDVYDIELADLLGDGWLRWRNKSDLLVELHYAH